MSDFISIYQYLSAASAIGAHSDSRVSWRWPTGRKQR